MPSVARKTLESSSSSVAPSSSLVPSSSVPLGLSREEPELSAEQKASRRMEIEAEQRTVTVRMTRSEELDLSMMGLKQLPADWLMAMRFVRFIDLSFNLFGEWPEEALRPHCDELQYLILAGCQLRAIPESIGRFTALKELTLNGNKFAAIPAEIGACQKLEKFNVSNNELRALPESIGFLNKLEELIVSGNQLGRLPDSIGNLASLQVLDASACGLNSLPDELVYCTQLMDLNLGSNNLIRLPSRIGWLQRAVSIQLAGNQLKDVPLSIGLCEGLNQIGVGLNISHNPIADREMMKQYAVGADRLFNYLERRMMSSDFNERQVMQGGVLLSQIVLGCLCCRDARWCVTESDCAWVSFLP
jgi:Leucine-rich repeat (LRR) protein